MNYAHLTMAVSLVICAVVPQVLPQLVGGLWRGGALVCLRHALMPTTLEALCSYNRCKGLELTSICVCGILMARKRASGFNVSELVQNWTYHTLESYEQISWRIGNVYWNCSTRITELYKMSIRWISVLSKRSHRFLSAQHYENQT